MTARGLLSLVLVSAVVATAPAQQGFAVPSNLAPPPPPSFDPPKIVMTPPPTVVDGGGLLPSERPAKIWSGGGEVGLNGAEGNSKLFNFRTGSPPSGRPTRTCSPPTSCTPTPSRTTC